MIVGISSFKKFLFFTLFLFGCSACSLLNRPSPLSTLSLENYVQANPEQFQAVHQWIETSNTSLLSFVTLIEGSAKRTLGREKFHQQIIFLSPDKFRTDFSVTNFNQPIALILLKNSVIQAFDVQSSTLFEGSGSQENIERLFSVPLSTEELMLLFCGRFPLPSNEEATESKLFINDNQGHFLFDYRLKDGRKLRLLFIISSPEFPLLSKLEISPKSEGTPRLVGEFVYDEQFKASSITTKNLEARPLTNSRSIGAPKELHLFFPHKELSLLLHYEKVAVNTLSMEQAEKLFHVDFPVGIERHNLDNAETQKSLHLPFD